MSEPISLDEALSLLKELRNIEAEVTVKSIYAPRNDADLAAAVEALDRQINVMRRVDDFLDRHRAASQIFLEGEQNFDAPVDSDDV